MSVDSATFVAIWFLLLAVILAAASRTRFPGRLDRPIPQPLRLDPVYYDFDGPVIDLEPA